MVMLLKNVEKKLSKYVDVSYCIRFILLLSSLYYFNIFYISVIDEKGLIYSSFLDNHFNYISWLRNSFLYTSSLIVQAFGIDSVVDAPYHLRTVKGSFVEMVYACLGFGLMSFWVAFVVCDKAPVKTKIIWCAGGILCIWFINTWRVALLLIALEHHWKVNALMDHHTLFNIVGYSLIAFLISRYIKNTRKDILKKEHSQVVV